MNRSEAHLSALDLDALALGALPATDAARVRTHLASCSACRADDESAAALRAHFTAHVLPRMRPPVPRRRWQLAWLALPALAAAAVVVLVALRPRHDELGIKGSAAWQVFANHDGQTFAVRDGTALSPGDRIRFVVEPDGAHYLIVASVDGSGAASIYYPYGGRESAPIDGTRVELDGSIVLDAAPGPERLFALFSDEPLAADAVRERLLAIGASGPEAIRKAHALDVAARAQTTLVFEKAVP
jgi:putative zinc finger protein